VLALTTIGCGQERPAAPPSPDVDLRVLARDGSSPARRARVRCAPPVRELTGFLRTRAEGQVCAQARALGGFLARAPDRNRVCASVYGGPETARIVGRIGRRRVARSFARTNACEIADWEHAQALLPRPAPRGA
jgi:hypothetical protein